MKLSPTSRPVFILTATLCLVVAACAGSPDSASEEASGAEAGVGAAEPEERAAAAAPRRTAGVRRSAGPPRGAPRVDIDVENVTLAYLVNDVAGEVGRGIVVDRWVDETVTLQLADAPWREALDIMAELSGCEVVPLPGGTLLLQQPAFVTMTGRGSAKMILGMIARSFGASALFAPGVEEVMDASSHGLSEGLPLGDALARIGAELGLTIRRQGAVLLVSPQPVAWGEADLSGLRSERPRIPAAPSRSAEREAPVRVDVDVFRQPLGEVARRVGQVAGCDVRVVAPADELVSLSLRHAPWSEALEVLALLGGCTLEVRGEAVVLAQRPRSRLRLGSAAPARAWFALLARKLGLELDMPPELDRPLRVEGELAYVRTADAARLHAELSGLRVGGRDGLLLVRAGADVIPPPRRGPALAVAGEPELRAAAIAYDPAGSLAVLEEGPRAQVVTEGDRVEGQAGMRVVRITPDAVLLASPEGEVHLPLE